MLSNFFRINYSFDRFDARVFPYSKETLDRLRELHNKTHSFFRIADEIYGLWNCGNDIQEGSLVSVSSEQNEIIDRATRHLVFRKFAEELKGRKPLSFYPLQILADQDKFDAAIKHMPAHLKGVLQYLKLTEIHLRTVFVDSQRINGLVFNVRRQWKLKKDLRQLIADGFEVVGRPVVFKSVNQNATDVLDFEEISIGRIVSISGDKCVVDTNNGKEEFDLDDLSLRKSRSDVVDLLDHYNPHTSSKHTIQNVYQDGSLKADAKHYFDEIEGIVFYLKQWVFVANCGFGFQIDENYQLNLPSIDLSPTSYVFDYKPGSVSSNVVKGLIEHGPFDSKRFTPRVPKILAVCSSTARGGFTRMLGSLEKGIPSSSHFKQGLVDLYDLEGIDWQMLEIEDSSAKNYRTEVLSRIEEEEYNLVLMEGNSETSLRDLASNPYWVTRSLCLSNGIPVQAIQERNFRKSPDSIQWVLAPLALQIYAKLGGTPWAIECSNDVDHEIIVGIGHYLERDSEFKGARTRRFVGVTTFFSREGKFILTNKCKAVEYEEYLVELKDNLRRSITKISEDDNWKKSATVRLIFHVFKPLRKDEADAIDELIREFPSFEIKHAFVTVSNQQPMVMFDDYKFQKEGKGYWVPKRMTNAVISPFETLIQLKGKNEVRSNRHGFSNPTIVRIHESSTFKDIHYITQQVYDFTFLSWRSLSPMNVPATIFYSNLVAENLKKLSYIPGWNPTAVNVQLKNKKWFL